MAFTWQSQDQVSNEGLERRGVTHIITYYLNGHPTSKLPQNGVLIRYSAFQEESSQLQQSREFVLGSCSATGWIDIIDEQGWRCWR